MATIKIRLPREVRGDFPFRGSVAPSGIYDAEMNPQGALSVLDSDGQLLGIKPGEFEFVDEVPEQWKEIVRADPAGKGTR